jgi:DNA-directed RNA polymerase subunit RPC12/RpoP
MSLVKCERCKKVVATTIHVLDKKNWLCPYCSERLVMRKQTNNSQGSKQPLITHGATERMPSGNDGKHTLDKICKACGAQGFMEEFNDEGYRFYRCECGHEEAIE